MSKIIRIPESDTIKFSLEIIIGHNTDALML